VGSEGLKRKEAACSAIDEMNVYWSILTSRLEIAELTRKHQASVSHEESMLIQAVHDLEPRPFAQTSVYASPLFVEEMSL
jgi:hypothetical protein